MTSKNTTVEYQVWYSASGGSRISGRRTFKDLALAEKFIDKNCPDYHRLDQVTRKVLRLKGHE